ncbi:MAG: endopeptidase La [Bdellovibrionales bacterium]|nr:endopeptidase La [Bdellovibrionales bacterium]
MNEKHIGATKLPLISLKDTVIFPQSILSVYINTESAKKLVQKAFEGKQLVFLSCLKDSPPLKDAKEVYKTGCVALVMRIKKLNAENSLKILVQGLYKARIESLEKDGFVHLKSFKEREVKFSERQKLLFEDIKQSLDKLESLSQQTVTVLRTVEDPSSFCEMLVSQLEVNTKTLQKFLEISDVEERLKETHRIFKEDLEMSNLQGRLKSLIKNPLSHSLSPSSENLNSHKTLNPYKKEEVRNYKENLDQKDLPGFVKKETLRQLNRLEKMHMESSEASIIRNYLDWILDLPWNDVSEDNLDIKNAERILNEDHHGLEKIKERILEFLAVCHLKPNALKGPILCFAGPPGVGKTSLGRSVAKALGRTYHRISLGGVKDESEIRGHRRTYVGSMPGRIIQALKTCKTKNPVIVLDEIDKLCSDFKGDPSAALLEVLDQEQNKTFRDHYLNVDFDLSQVFFIATANLIQNIPPALRDRLEVIRLPGYTLEEKKQIVNKYLISKELENNGLPKEHINLEPSALNFLIQSYTREAGLRNLSRSLASLCRKTAKKFVLGEKEKQFFNKKQVESFLGSPLFYKEENLKTPEIGFVTGLAWTEAGGEVLPIESIKVKSQKSNLILTGKLGEVMRESAQASLSYIKSYVQKMNLKQISFDKHEIHIHVPGGAVPKDGPSAGIAIASSLLSLVTDVPIKNTLAMTGEITLSGRVLPVGGIKEKVLAAFNNGIQTVILPDKNLKDLDEVPVEIRQSMKIILVSHLSEVFKHVLLFEPASKSKLGEYFSNEEIKDTVA